MRLRMVHDVTATPTLSNAVPAAGPRPRLYRVASLKGEQ